MKLTRRLLLSRGPLALLAWGAAGGAAHAQAQQRISLATLQDAVAQRFPLSFPVAGLLQLALQAPRLALLPEENRLLAEVPLEAAGPALRRAYEGGLDLDFGLRYEASDRSIRAHRIRFRGLRLPGLRPDAAEWIATFGPRIAEESLGEVVLHRLQARDLALPDAMGLQPDRITVTQQGLAIDFVAKPS